MRQLGPSIMVGTQFQLVEYVLTAMSTIIAVTKKFGWKLFYILLVSIIRAGDAKMLALYFTPNDELRKKYPRGACSACIISWVLMRYVKHGVPTGG